MEFPFPFHITSSLRFTWPQIREIFDRANEIARCLTKHPSDPRWESLKTRKNFLAAIVFYEPSTRTRFSFDIAARHLGMKVVFSEAAGQFSSTIKGESLEHTSRVLAGYTPHVLIQRHKYDDAAERTVEAIDRHGYRTSLVNGGSGTNEHPTQALLDLYTIEKEFGLDNVGTVVLGGDLAHGRTVHSLVYLLAKFGGPRLSFVFVSPPELTMRSDMLAFLEKKGVPYRIEHDLAAGLEASQIIYWTRLQRERWPQGEDSDTAYRKIAQKYSIGPAELDIIPPEAIIMHPLPIDARMPEIRPECESDPRIRYFEQAENGLPVRMAILEAATNWQQ